jgi:putative flippase GtrA
MAHRVSRFVAVGVFNTGLDFAILNVLVFVVGFAVLPANIISTLTAMSFSYILNHSFVFKAEEARSKRQYLLFIGITVFGLLVIQNGIIHIMTNELVAIPNALYTWIVSPLFGSTFSQEFIQLNFAKATATLATMIWNYQLYKRVVFKDKTPRLDDQEIPS